MKKVWETITGSKKGIVCLAVAAVILLGCLGWGGYAIWHFQQPKFQDVTVELGTESVQITQFMTKHARLKKVSFVSDLSVIDLSKTGETPLTLRHGSQEETVMFRVQDTTAPDVAFVQELTVTGDYIPKAEDFVESVSDVADTTIVFAEEVKMPADYTDRVVTVVVTDESGNAVQAQCTMHVTWLQPEVTLEYGQQLTKEDLLLVPELDAPLVKQEDLDRINAAPLGTYTLESTTGGKTETCTVTVQDTMGPVVEVQKVCVYPGEEAGLEDFIVSSYDPSGEVTLELKTPLDTETLGFYPVTIEAKDIYGNVSTYEVEFRVSTDEEKPSFSGTKGTLRVVKGSMPDYLDGVTATDEIDGEVTVTVDDSDVNLQETGDYTIVYTAVDLSGNVATKERKVRVVEGSSNNMELIKETANKLPDDPEEIRDWVRKKIRYSYSWGGEDPVEYGLKYRKGNCYVHAVVLQALLEYKGYETQMIWVKDRSHYWLIIKLGDVWRHIDATPSQGYHNRYSLMTDEQRASTLKGREWDREKWPACDGEL